MIETFIILCWVMAAICNAAMDVLAFKFKTSVFRNLNHMWWRPSISWLNKYKDKTPSKGAAFFGSTTFLVFLTDAWHLFQMLMGVLIILCICLVSLLEYNLAWYYVLCAGIGFKFVWGFVFELFYSKVFRVKK